MIIDEIKTANLNAMKNKDTNLRSIYSVVINKYMLAEIEARTSERKLTDDDTTRILQKTIKELTEEAENYKKVNNLQEYERILVQKSVLEKYLPKMLSEEEIKNVILTLNDKSLPFVMKHFKTSFGARVDLKLVGQILKTM